MSLNVFDTTRLEDRETFRYLDRDALSTHQRMRLAASDVPPTQHFFSSRVFKFAVEHCCRLRALRTNVTFAFFASTSQVSPARALVVTGKLWFG